MSDREQAYEAAREVLGVPFDAVLLGEFTSFPEGELHCIYFADVRTMVTDLVDAALNALEATHE